VRAETPVQVVDPITGAVLDTVDREKVRVEAYEVRDKIAICRTYRIKGSVTGGLLRAADFARYFGTEPSPETLRITDDSTPPPLSEEESYVKTNDRVIAIPND
jgi:hypothetical protein